MNWHEEARMGAAREFGKRHVGWYIFWEHRSVWGGLVAVATLIFGIRWTVVSWTPVWTTWSIRVAVVVVTVATLVWLATRRRGY